MNNGNVVSLNIENAESGQAIPSTMHGIILETNINRDDDGGLYAELIYNRAFQGCLIFENAILLITKKFYFRKRSIIGWMVDVWSIIDNSQ